MGSKSEQKGSVRRNQPRGVTKKEEETNNKKSNTTNDKGGEKKGKEEKEIKKKVVPPTADRRNALDRSNNGDLARFASAGKTTASTTTTTTTTTSNHKSAEEDPIIDNSTRPGEAEETAADILASMALAAREKARMRSASPPPMRSTRTLPRRNKSFDDSVEYLPTPKSLPRRNRSFDSSEGPVVTRPTPRPGEEEMSSSSSSTLSRVRRRGRRPPPRRSMSHDGSIFQRGTTATAKRGQFTRNKSSGRLQAGGRSTPTAADTGGSLTRARSFHRSNTTPLAADARGASPCPERRKNQIKLLIEDSKRRGIKPPLMFLKEAMDLGVISVPSNNSHNSNNHQACTVMDPGTQSMEQQQSGPRRSSSPIPQQQQQQSPSATGETSPRQQPQSPKKLMKQFNKSAPAELTVARSKKSSHKKKKPKKKTGDSSKNASFNWEMYQSKSEIAAPFDWEMYRHGFEAAMKIAQQQQQQQQQANVEG